MKACADKAIKAGSEADRIHANRLPLLWICILAALFYLASVFVALAGESLNSQVSARPVAAISSSASARARLPWFKRMFYRPSWPEVVEQSDSPEAICDLVGRYVSYRTEDVDTWNSAEYTWQQGRGDCEDLAICIQELCHKMGFSATVNLYFPSDSPREGHAVVVGTRDGQMWMSSNGSFEVVRSIDDVKEAVARVLGCKKDEMWGSVLAHADVQRRIGVSSARSVALAQY